VIATSKFSIRDRIQTANFDAAGAKIYRSARIAETARRKHQASSK